MCCDICLSSRHMAPYIPSKTLENLSHLFDAAQRRQLMPLLQETELCSGASCRVTQGDTGETSSMFTQLMPFMATLDEHPSLQTIAVPTQSGTVTPTNTPAAVHISSSAVVCMTLGFVSVLLGLGAMALTRTRWYRWKKEEWDKICWRKKKEAEPSILPQITFQPHECASAESSLATILEDSEEDTSEESCFSEQTAGLSPASSMTSVELESEEEDEEGAQVHRAQTQSVEIKRAVLISVPPHVTARLDP